MTTPSGRREALDILTRRGLSQRKACNYLGCSRRVAGYQLVQPDKDKMMGEPTISEGLLRKSPTRMVSLSTVHRLVKQASVTERVEKKAEANALKLAEKQKVRKAYLEHLYVTPTYRAYASATASLYRAKKENHPKLAAYEKKHAEAKAAAAELRKQLRAKLGL